MKPAYSCKLFGAHQALSGIRNAVVLFHSVVGCQFGSLSFHVPQEMTRINQTCTVISDSDVVFSGENSLSRALRHVEELYAPQAIFVVTGCVSDIIQDDIHSVAADFSGRAQVVTVEAAGYRGGISQGYEAGLVALAGCMEPCPKSLHPRVNLLGLGADDPRLSADISAFRELLDGQVELGAVLSHCTWGELRQAPAAHLNLVLGRGLELAKCMENRFGIPYQVLDYPCGLTGAQALWDILSGAFGLDFSPARDRFIQRTAQGLAPAYSYLQALYGIPAALVASSARARGLAHFLTRELGLELVCQAERESLEDVEDFFDQVRISEAALLFGSSFEAELADDMELPLFRCDYPVFDRVCVTDRPLIGPEGTLHFVEDLLNEIMVCRRQKGALYQ